MYNTSVEIARQQRSKSADLDSWRKGSATRQEAAWLRRQNYYFDFKDLDRTAERLKITLEPTSGFVTRLGAVRDFYEALDQVVEGADSDIPGIYSLRKKLFSLRCRTRSVLREMRNQSRAPEFDRQALRAILKDYESLRD
jgi:hypothetical protein